MEQGNTSEVKLRLSSYFCSDDGLRRRRQAGQRRQRGKTQPNRRSSLPPTPADSFSEEDIAEEGHFTAKSRSIGVGTFQPNGHVKFESVPEDHGEAEDLTCSSKTMMETSSSSSSSSRSPHYLRISDLLKWNSSLQSSLHSSDLSSSSSATRAASPSSIEEEENNGAVDQWLWLGCVTNSPVAVNALAEIGWSVAMNPELWTFAQASSGTAQRLRAWQDATFQKSWPLILPLPIEEWPVLVWTGKLHGLHRSDLPAVRAATVLSTSPEQLTDLLIDSCRVQEYNPHSQGRVDLQVLQSSFVNGNYGGVTKIMRSTSKPPFLRKSLEFTSLLHARPIMNGRGYLIVTRSVSKRHGNAAAPSLSEILLSVNLLLPICNDEQPPLGQQEVRAQRTLMITVNHIHSPLIPMLLAKRIGIQAAANFLADLERCTKTNSRA